MKQKDECPDWLHDLGRRGETIVDEARRLEGLAKKQRNGSPSRLPAFGRNPRDFM